MTMTTEFDAVPKPRFLGAVLSLIEALRRRAARARAVARDREILRQFADMDDALLADIGLTRADLARIARECGVRL